MSDISDKYSVDFLRTPERHLKYQLAKCGKEENPVALYWDFSKVLIPVCLAIATAIQTLRREAPSQRLYLINRRSPGPADTGDTAEREAGPDKVNLLKKLSVPRYAVPITFPIEVKLANCKS